MRHFVLIACILCSSLACTTPHVRPSNGTQEISETKHCFKPLSRVPPRYPSQAVDSKIEGKVLVEGTITPEGRVVDVHIIAAEPAGVFDEVTLTAVRQWRYPRRGAECPNPLRILIPFALER